MDVIDGRFEPVKRTALDGKTWWVVYDNKRHGYSSYLCHGTYETRKQCEQAIEASYKYFCGVSGETGRSVERRGRMTNYNDLRDGQAFYANGYKKGYEDAKKDDISPDEISKILADFILDDIENADEDFVKAKFESLGVTQELLDTLGVDYRLEEQNPGL